jgi:hypothetical protein
VFGVLLVVFLGSNPFQLYEAYRHEQIFGWPIAMFALTFALLVPVMLGTTRRWIAPIAAALCGVVLGTAYHVRVEAAVPIASVVMALLTAPRARMWIRVATAVLAVAAFSVTVSAWARFFDHKWAEATAVVRQAGGHVYDGVRAARHQIWASIWAGLGDFDQTHGYKWSDEVQVRYVDRVIEERYGESLPWWWGTRKPDRTADDFYDADHMYYRHYLDNPHFLDVVRDKVLSDIEHEPMWYAGIIARRAWRVLTHTTPVRVLAVPSRPLTIPFSGLLLLPILGGAMVLRDGFAIRALLFALPLSLPALAIYSGGNLPYYGVYHLVAAAIVLTWALHAMLAKRRHDGWRLDSWRVA